MTKQTLYSLRHSSENNFTITKFVDGEVESSYELAANLRECACPAGHRPSCRHRQMAPMMLAHGIIGTHWFWDFDLNRAVDFQGNLKSNFDALNELAAPGHTDLMISPEAIDEALAVGEAQHTEVKQLPPGDYTAEVGKIKTFDDGVVMMQMKNIKPWRRL